MAGKHKAPSPPLSEPSSKKSSSEASEAASEVSGAAMTQANDPVFTNPNDLVGDGSVEADKERLKNQIRRTSAFIGENYEDVSDIKQIMLQLKKMDVKLEKALGTDIPKHAKMIQEAFDSITGTEAELDEVRANVSNCVKIQDLEPTLLHVVDSKFPVIAEAVFREI